MTGLLRPNRRFPTVTTHLITAEPLFHRDTWREGRRWEEQEEGGRTYWHKQGGEEVEDKGIEGVRTRKRKTNIQRQSWSVRG